MFKENNLLVVAEYPENEIMKKSALKVYAVGNTSVYSNINDNDIFETIQDEVGYREVIGKTVISQHIPLDVNGNIDKDELTKLIEHSTNSVQRGSVILPQTETERRVADIWKKLLECGDISTDVNFFESGGDSLLASMMVTEIKKSIPSAENIEWEKLMQSILQNTTIKDIASMLDNISIEKDFVVEYQHGSEKPSQVWALFVNGTGTMAIYNQLLQLMKEGISEDDRIIGLHCGDFNEYIKMPSNQVMNTLSNRNAEYLAELGAKRYNLIGHCFGGGVAIQTAYNLNKMNINNVSVVTIDSRRWNVFCDNPLVIERGFAQMMGSNVSKCGHTVSDEMLQDTLGKFVRKHGRIMSEEEICTCEEIDVEVRECFSKLRKIPQDERLAMMFHETDSPQNKEQERQFIMLYKVFYQCLMSFTAFKPDMYSGEVHAVRANDRSNFFIPVENADESDYLKESVSGVVHDYYFDGDHFTCLTDDKNVKLLAEIVLKNKM
jgi:pyochelin synthetase